MEQSMKYTLFAFQLHESDLTDGRGASSPIGEVLAQTEKHRVDICDGIYVFETQKGWQGMHRLRSLLTHRKQTFVELPFEQALAGFFPADVCDRLREIGKSSGQEISLLNLRPE
jgi:hypothetical protein